MRILQASDLHIDFYAKKLSKVKIENGKNVFYQQRLQRLSTIIDIGLDHKVDAFLFSGDFFNRVKPVPQEYIDVFDILNKIPPNIPIFAISGNHDELTSRGSALDPFKGRRKNYYIVTNPLEASVVSFKGFNIALCPWNTPNSFIYRLLDETPSHLTVLHLGILAKGLHWGEIEGESGIITLDELRQLNTLGIAIGHYHGQTDFDHDIWYCGSPECFNFGEQEQTKGILLWDINDTITTTPIPLDYAKFYTYDIDSFLNTDEKGMEAYVRVKGIVSNKDRLKILEKAKSFDCFDIKLDLVSEMKTKNVKHIKGTTTSEILQDYLKSKEIPNEEIAELLKLDQEIISEVDL